MKTSANSHTGSPPTSGSSRETRGVSAKTSTSLGFQWQLPPSSKGMETAESYSTHSVPHFLRPRQYAINSWTEAEGIQQIKDCLDKDCAKQSPRREAEWSNSWVSGYEVPPEASGFPPGFQGTAAGSAGSISSAVKQLRFTLPFRSIFLDIAEFKK